MRYYYFELLWAYPGHTRLYIYFWGYPNFLIYSHRRFLNFLFHFFFQLYISYPYFLSFVLILCDPVLISAGIWVQVQYIYLKQRSWSIICCFQDLPCIIHTVNILNLPSFVHLSRFIINGQSFAIMSRFFSSLL